MALSCLFCRLPPLHGNSTRRWNEDRYTSARSPKSQTTPSPEYIFSFLDTKLKMSFSFITTISEGWGLVVWEAATWRPTVGQHFFLRQAQKFRTEVTQLEAELLIVRRTFCEFFSSFDFKIQLKRLQSLVCVYSGCALLTARCSSTKQTAQRMIEIL